MNIPHYYELLEFSGNTENSKCFVKSYKKNSITIEKTNSCFKFGNTEIDEYTIVIPNNDQLLYLSLVDKSLSKNPFGIRFIFKWADSNFPGNHNERLIDMISPIVNCSYLGAGINTTIPGLTNQYGIDSPVNVFKKVYDNCLELNILSKQTFYSWMNVTLIL